MPHLVLALAPAPAPAPAPPVLSIPPTLCLGLFFGEFNFLQDANFAWTVHAVGALFMSCVVGVGISYAGFNLRKQVGDIATPPPTTTPITQPLPLSLIAKRAHHYLSYHH